MSGKGQNLRFWREENLKKASLALKNPGLVLKKSRLIPILAS